MPKENIKELNLLRGIAFLAVVLQHTIGVFIKKSDILLGDAVLLGILFNVVKFAVPTFVFLTGVVLVYNYYENFSYQKFIWKRTLDIFLPYALWSVIYFAYYNGLGLNVDSLKSFAKQLVLGSSSYHLWYIVMIFQFYLLLPVFLFLFKLLKPMLDDIRKTLILVITLAGLYTLLMWFSSYYIPAGFYKPESYLLQALFIKYRSVNFLFYSFYFLLGGIAAFHLAKWRKFLVKFDMWNLVLLIILFCLVGVQLLQGVPQNGVVNLNISTSLKPSMFFYTVSSIIFLYRIALAILKRSPQIARLLALLGDYAFGAYLVHALALTFSVRLLMPYFHYDKYLFMLLLVFLLTSFVSVGLTYILHLSPMGYLLIGKINPRKKEM